MLDDRFNVPSIDYSRSFSLLKYVVLCRHLVVSKLHFIKDTFSVNSHLHDVQLVYS